MEKLYKSITKLPDTEIEIITMKANGKKATRKKLVTDRYLLTLNNGDSVAIIKDQFKEFGISAPEISQKPSKVQQIVEKLEENDEDPEVLEEIV